MGLGGVGFAGVGVRASSTVSMAVAAVASVAAVACPPSGGPPGALVWLVKNLWFRTDHHNDRLTQRGHSRVQWHLHRGSGDWGKGEGGGGSSLKCISRIT